ncbi:TRAP transporter substrate-binding protein [Rhizobium halophytocola]|uniref:TRAP-type C4-dicarboxylate transport system substrate-binding protein n=1 Tax=Rhizobium halophytocola TaxID=735519 RepID=A0ABS4E0I5_9HYPH|nr:TRAP transporter substrate-binding protein [Rhizobium halophytocola]MBP1851459.1 TRAP-type C4-dicarboxylate transport system substrate-binding protein [Rhizobium halophytocola]
MPFPKLIASMAIALGSLLANVGGASADTTLNMANWLPPAHPLMKDVMVPYAEAIKEATDGRVTVNVLPAPLGPPAAHFDFAVNGVADITYGVQGYNPGRFKTTAFAELPFLGDSAEANSVGYWRVFDKTLRKAGEYDKVHVLAVFTHGPGQIFTKGRDLSTLDGVKGAKIRVGGGIVGDLVKGLGAVPVEGPSSKTYELLSSGVADGITFPFESVASFKLIPMVDSALVVPGGLFNTSFYVVMNKAKWDALSDEDKKAIDGVSGEALARRAGKMWDAADAAGKAAMEGKVKLVPASDTEMEGIKADLKPVIDAQMAEAAKAGIDVEAVRAAMHEEVEKAAKGE